MAEETVPTCHVCHLPAMGLSELNKCLVFWFNGTSSVGVYCTFCIETAKNPPVKRIMVLGS